MYRLYYLIILLSRKKEYLIIEIKELNKRELEIITIYRKISELGKERLWKYATDNMNLPKYHNNVIDFNWAKKQQKSK